MNNIKVEQMEGNNGPVKNQFLIYTQEGVYFQSYNTLIAFRNRNGKVTLDRDSWDYSVTTGKYRNIFLGEDKKTTESKIKTGVYILADLN